MINDDIDPSKKKKGKEKKASRSYVFFAETNQAIQRTHATVQVELAPSRVTLEKSW